MLYLTNKEKELLREKKVIKVMLAIIFAGLSVLIVFIFKDLFYGKNKFEVHSLVYAYGLMSVNLLLGLMACISSGIHYISNKKNNFYIISLFYLSILVNSLSNIDGDIMNNYFIQILSPSFRLFILSGIVNKKRIFSEEKKFINIISVCILSIITSEIDTKISDMVINDNSGVLSLISFVIMLSLIIGYIIINTILIKKSLEEIESGYVCIIASIYLIVIRWAYFLHSAWNPEIKIIQRNFYSLVYLTIMANLAVITGVFIEIIKEINKNRKLEKELKIFYYVSELDCINNILVTDSEWNVIYVNETALNNYCYKENKDKNYYEIHKSFDEYRKHLLDFDGEKLHEIVENKGFWKGKIVREDNEKASLLYVRKINFDNQVYYFASFNDITTEYKLSKEIEEKEALLSTINDNIQDIIIGVSDDDVIKYVNKAALNTFNYSYDELVGEKLDKIMYSCKRHTEFNDINKKFNCIGIDSTNNKIELKSICNDISEENDPNLKKIIISKDLTQERQYEKLNDEYNKIKAYENAKNEFFANLSHELRTPINIISSTLQLLNKARKNDIYMFIDFYDKYKKVLGTNCYRMLRLVNNLIDITKFEVGALKTDFVNTNIVELVENVSLSVIPYAKEKNIDIIFDTDIEESIIKCDMEKIERIILNLLSNSIKFSKKDKTIFVDVISNKEWIKISVRDEGRGIPKTMQEFIFDRFVQVDKSLSRKTEGSGIGLSIVKALIDMHDGKISVNSELDKGTTFDIYLPNKILEDKEITSFDEFNIDTKKVELELSDIYELYG